MGRTVQKASGEEADLANRLTGISESCLEIIGGEFGSMRFTVSILPAVAHVEIVSKFKGDVPRLSCRYTLTCAFIHPCARWK